MNNHEFYIKRCLQIAKNGIGASRPNPSVGAVIVFDQKIIGEGFTANYGQNHAEVNAVNAVKNKNLLKEATIYVTLEPCSHFGKTPPCADLLIKHQFKKVVIGAVDANKLVAGKGIDRLKKAGINVIVGVLEKECKAHHKRFFTVQEKKRPYILLKWAETKDGFIFPELDSGAVGKKNSNEIKNTLKQVKGKPVWISNKISQQLVHKFRSEEHAILVGTNTVVADNPKLNVRSWSGNNPVRIVLDLNLRIPKEANIFDKSVKTIVLKSKGLKSLENSENLIFEKIESAKNIAAQICEVLHTHQIQSLLIEGGTKILQTFIDANLWDEANVFIGETSFENGIKAPKFSAKIASQLYIKNDILNKYIND